MEMLTEGSHLILCLIAAMFVILGVMRKNLSCVMAALWISLFTLCMQYHASGGEILGNYFNYKHATVYSITLLTLLVSFTYLIFNTPFIQQQRLRTGIASFIGALLSAGVVCLLINLWMNAWFIEKKHNDTPIFQIAQFSQPTYCTYRYVFYKVGEDNRLYYMCPNYYGFIPSIGKLDHSPEYVLKQLPMSVQEKIRTQEAM